MERNIERTQQKLETAPFSNQFIVNSVHATGQCCSYFIEDSRVISTLDQHTQYLGENVSLGRKQPLIQYLQQDERAKVTRSRQQILFCHQRFYRLEKKHNVLKYYRFSNYVSGESNQTPFLLFRANRSHLNLNRQNLKVIQTFSICRVSKPVSLDTFPPTPSPFVKTVYFLQIQTQQKV